MKARLELIYSISILADFPPNTQRIFILCTTLHYAFLHSFFLLNTGKYDDNKMITF
jgi:hypothetical protein